MRTANDHLVASVAELQRRDEEMKSLIRLNDLLQSCTTQAEAYQVVAHVAIELFAGQSGCLAILYASDHHLETVACWGDETPLKPSFSLEDCWGLRRGKLHEVSDPRTDLLCHHFVHEATGRLFVCAFDSPERNNRTVVPHRRGAERDGFSHQATTGHDGGRNDQAVFV